MKKFLPIIFLLFALFQNEGFSQVTKTGTTAAKFLSIGIGPRANAMGGAFTSLANDAGIAVNTAKSWLSLLEASYILFLLHPYFNNFRFICTNLKSKKFETFSNHMCQFNYRNSIFKTNKDLLVWSATLKMSQRSKKEIEELIEKSINFRKNKYPQLPSAGSIFKNIGPDYIKEKINPKYN
jgi:hypothetical protein